MSMLADIQYNLSTDELKSKLTLHERAYLLCDITDSLQWDSYNKYDSEGNFICVDIAQAILDLQRIDNEKKS